MQQCYQEICTFKSVQSTEQLIHEKEKTNSASVTWMRTNPWPTSFPSGRTSSFRMTKLEHSGSMCPHGRFGATRVLSVHPCSCPPANSCSSTKLGVLPCCRIDSPPKRRRDEREPLPGKKEERSTCRTTPCGLLEPWSENRRTTGAMACHMASHRGFAGSKGAPTFRSRSCCNV